MAERKAFLLRIDRALLDDVQRWANDDLRSLNGQIEFLLRRALRETGRGPSTDAKADKSTSRPADAKADEPTSRPADKYEVRNRKSGDGTPPAEETE